jgi:hypothetical protein
MATLAPALTQLFAQINARFPTRSKASDGWIGDAAHAARPSSHNPDRYGVVRAIDVTEDLAVGLDCNRLMEELDASNDPRIFYLIHDYEIDNSDDSRTPYSGSNPHTKHLHISVDDDPAVYNDSRPWALPLLEDDVMTQAQFDALKAHITKEALARRNDLTAYLEGKFRALGGVLAGTGSVDAAALADLIGDELAARLAD